jgi:DNA-binding response OmpR family regulator
MKILIIEEDLSLSRFLASALGRENYQVQVWGETEGAAVDRDFDLVLLDLSLRGQDGVAVLRRFRQQKPVAFIIVLTVRDRGGDPAHYLDAERTIS